MTINENNAYIYIRDHQYYQLDNIYKVGITTSIKDRDNTYITGEYRRGYFVKIYELNINREELINIDNSLKKKFKYLNNYNNGGTEFYDRKIINLIENFLLNEVKINFTIKTIDELKRINRTNDINNRNEIKLRDYQLESILFISNELELNNRCYLYLPTGAGKTLISVNIISNIKPLNVIIFSPRINIRNQNINDKYLKILNNYSLNNNIYSYCYQSYKNVYNLIINNNLQNLFIWFDEAHWTLDNWIINNDNEIKQFFINDNNYIKYRLFTTASPNKDFVINNKDKFGKLYEPIKFKELQEKKFLSEIEVEIFDREIEKEQIEYNDLIFNTFNKPNQERKMGFSFHNSCNSAYISYLHHLKDYNKCRIDIKPYLLINDEFIKKEKKINNNRNENDDLENDLKIIKKIKKDIGNIDYFNNIKNFEEEFNKNQKVIGYVVAKYSIGYDNSNIDIIYFTDYKLSYKDIIQSIGRGTRTNEKDYKDKYLRIILPTNRNNNIGFKYDKIENILKYLLLDIELDYDKIKSYKIKNNKNLNDLSLIISSSSYYFDEDIDEKSSINTMKLKIIMDANKWTIPKIITQLKSNNIHNIEDYNDYRNKKSNLNLPDINELFNNSDFNFRDTYYNENECPYYYEKNDCIKIIKKNENYFIINDIIDNDEKLNYLNSIDEKIPKMNLWLFYGGNKNDYF